MSSYIEWTQLFFEANNIEVEKKVATFLSVVGVKTYELLHNLMAPELLEEKKVDEIMEPLKQHFDQNPW